MESKRTKAEIDARLEELNKKLADANKALGEADATDPDTAVSEPADISPTPSDTIPDPDPTPDPAPDPTPVDKKNKAPLFDAEKEVADFVAKFRIDKLLPQEFKDLSKEKKWMVMRAVQQRMVDLVKSNAQTQYSEDVGKRKGFAKIRAFLNKESELKTFQAIAFEELNELEEGKKLIAQNLTQLTEMTKGRDVSINPETNKPEFIFINPNDYPEKSLERHVIANFNAAANKFREVPYEWGQEKKGKNREAYNKAKAEYDKANAEASLVEKKTKGEEAALVNMLQLDNVVKLDQLVNTHPEFEKEFIRLAKDGGLKEQIFDVWNLGGKGRFNKALMIGGFLARMGARGATLAQGMTALTGGLTVGIGATIGGIRGWFKAKETLVERKKQARYGQKDTSKARVHTTDATLLTNRLQRTITDLERFSKDGTPLGKKLFEKKLALLSLSIDHARGKMEKGQVNLGDANSTLVNQFNLLNALNNALTLKETYSVDNKDARDANIKNFMKSYIDPLSGELAEKTSSGQKKFIRWQVVKGAAFGAGAATAGYMVRWAAESLGWFGGHGGTDNLHAGDPHSAEGARTLAGHTKNMVGQAAFAQKDTLLAGKIDSLIGATKPDSASVVATKETLDALEKSLPGNTPASHAAIEAGKAKLDALLAQDSSETEAATTVTGAIETATRYPGNYLSHEMIFRLGENGAPTELEHLHEAMLLDHILPKNIAPGGTVLDAHTAAKVLNAAANMTRLAHGHATAGVSVEEWKKAFSFDGHNWAVKSPAGANDIMDKMMKHADRLDEKGVFNSDDSAMGWIGKVNWLKRIHADGMHDDVKIGDKGVCMPNDVQGHGIAGRTGVTQEQIEDFSKHHPVEHATNNHPGKVGVEVKSTQAESVGISKAQVDELINQMDDKFNKLHSSTEEIKRKITENMEARAKVPGPTTVPVEKAPTHIEPDVKSIPQKTPPGFFQPYNNPTLNIPSEQVHMTGGGYNTYNNPMQYGSIIHGNGAGDAGFFPDLTRAESDMLNGYPEFAENPFGLRGTMLLKVLEVSEKNLNHIFHGADYTEEWSKISDQGAQDVLDGDGVATGATKGYMSDYLKRLQIVTRLDPTGGFIRKSETVGHYLARALQKAAQMGKLGEIERFVIEKTK